MSDTIRVLTRRWECCSWLCMQTSNPGCRRYLSSTAVFWFEHIVFLLSPTQQVSWAYACFSLQWNADWLFLLSNCSVCENVAEGHSMSISCTPLLVKPGLRWRQCLWVWIHVQPHTRWICLWLFICVCICVLYDLVNNQVCMIGVDAYYIHKLVQRVSMSVSASLLLLPKIMEVSTFSVLYTQNVERCATWSMACYTWAKAATWNFLAKWLAFHQCVQNLRRKQRTH